MEMSKRVARAIVVATRMDLLEKMNNYVIELGDEEALYDHWCYLVPDCPTEEDFQTITESDEDWNEVIKLIKFIYDNYDEKNEEKESEINEYENY